MASNCDNGLKVRKTQKHFNSLHWFTWCGCTQLENNMQDKQEWFQMNTENIIMTWKQINICFMQWNCWGKIASMSATGLSPIYFLIEEWGINNSQLPGAWCCYGRLLWFPPMLPLRYLSKNQIRCKINFNYKRRN